MKNTQYSNGPEEAGNSSTVDDAEAAEYAKDYEFYLNSFYIATIATNLGYAGLSPALTATLDGIDYQFDFFHPKSRTYFKVFQGSDLQEYGKYASFSRTRVLIIDVKDVPGASGYYKSAVGPVVTLPKKIGVQMHQDRQTFLYSKGRLWERTDIIARGRCEWRAVELVMRHAKDFSRRSDTADERH